MTLGRVVGSLVSTMKLKSLEGYKILLVKPINPDGSATGESIITLDAVQAGVGDTVLVLEEGNSCRMIVGDPMAPIRNMIVAIVDSVSIEQAGLFGTVC